MGKSSAVWTPSNEAEINSMYCATSNRIEIHTCLILTRDKRKLYACTELGDNVLECYRRRVERQPPASQKQQQQQAIADSKKQLQQQQGNKRPPAPPAPPRNCWKFNGSLDQNWDKISGLVFSADETYMLASVIWGFKVIYMLTGQSKPLRFPASVKNIQIGYKKLTFPALFSRDNKYVVAGVRDNIYIWETSYGLYIKALDAHYGRITCLLGSFRDDKNLVLSSSMDKSIKIWNLNNIMEEDYPLSRMDKPIETLHASVNGWICMAQSRNQLAIYSLKDGKIKHQLCNNPHGAIFSCAAMTSTGTYAASSESNRLIIWDIEERRPTFISSSQSSLIHIRQIVFHQSEMCILVATLDVNAKLVKIGNYTVPDGEPTFSLEYNIKPEAEYRPFVVTTDDTYLVVFRNDKKQDQLSVYAAADGTALHVIKLQFTGYRNDFTRMVPMRDRPHFLALIDQEKGNLINLKEKKFVRSVKNWNGHATKDDKYGLYAPTRGGLELIDLKSGGKVKVMIPKVAEGVFDVDTVISEDNRVVAYYHSGKRTIRLFRLEDGRKIADYKSAAKVRCMICTHDSRNLIIGCEDGTLNMLIIADPHHEESVRFLSDWRHEQRILFSRDGTTTHTINI